MTSTHEMLLKLRESVSEMEEDPDFEFDKDAKREIMSAVRIAIKCVEDIEQEAENLCTLGNPDTERPKSVQGPLSPEMMRLASRVASELRDLFRTSRSR